MSKVIHKIQTQSEAETISFAKELAESLMRGDVVLFYGDLGMGKSVMARALVRHLCGVSDMDVPSPTFTLVQSYDSALGEIWHFDFYRLCAADEVYEIGWEEALAGDDEGLVLVEWPERLGSLLPEHAVEIHISKVKDHPDFRDIEVIRR